MANPVQIQRQQQVSNQRNVPGFIDLASTNTEVYRNSSISSLTPSTQTSQSFMDCLSKVCNKFLRLFVPIFGMSEKRLEYTKESVRASLNSRLHSLHSYQGKIFINMKVGTKFQQFSYHTSGGMNAMNDAIRKALVFFENEFKDNPFTRDYGFTTCCFERGYFLGADELRAHFDILEGKTCGIFYSEQKSKGSYALFNAALLDSNDRREQVIQHMNEKANLSLTQNDLFGNDHQLSLT